MYPWNSVGVLAPLILGFVLLVPFIYVEKVVAKFPIIPSMLIARKHMTAQHVY